MWPSNTWIYYWLLVFYGDHKTDVNDLGRNQAIGTNQPAIGGSADTDLLYDKTRNSRRVDHFVRKCLTRLVDKLDTVITNTSSSSPLSPDDDHRIRLVSTIAGRDVHLLRHYLSQDYHRLNSEQLEEFEETIHEFINDLVLAANDDNHWSLWITSLFQLMTKLVIYAMITFTTFVIIKSYLLNSIKTLISSTTNFNSCLSPKSLVIVATILLISASIVWKWRQKYLLELSRKQCYVLQTPEDCLYRHESLSFISWIRHYVYDYEQRRQDYYRAVTVDPIWEINPLTIVGELFAELIFLPLKAFGDSFGHFMATTFRQIPLYLVIPVFGFLSFSTVLLTLLMAVWLLMPNSYSIKIPFLMTIQFDRRQRQQQRLQQSQNNKSIVDNEPKQAVGRSYQIRANVVNVYHQLCPPNSTSFGTAFDNCLNESQMKFDDNMCFETNQPIVITDAELD